MRKSTIWDRDEAEGVHQIRNLRRLPRLNPNPVSAQVPAPVALDRQDDSSTVDRGTRAPRFRADVARLTRRDGTAIGIDDRARQRRVWRRIRGLEAAPARGRAFIYLWADGIHLGAGPADERRVLLVVIGADADGTKHLVALGEAMSESELSWTELFEDLKGRGLRAPSLLIADGANGLWAAAGASLSQTRRQRCWLHKVRNVLDKVPEKQQPRVHEELPAIVSAPSEVIARERIETLAQSLQRDYPKASTCLRDDIDRMVTFYRFRQASWRSLRTTSPRSSRSSPRYGYEPTRQSDCEQRNRGSSRRRRAATAGASAETSTRAAFTRGFRRSHAGLPASRSTGRSFRSRKPPLRTLVRRKRCRPVSPPGTVSRTISSSLHRPRSPALGTRR